MKVEWLKEKKIAVKRIESGEDGSEKCFSSFWTTTAVRKTIYVTVQCLRPATSSDIFYSIALLKRPMDTFNCFWDVLRWFHHSINHEAWLEKHWLRGYSCRGTQLSVALWLIRLFPNNIYLFLFECRLVFLGLFSLGLHSSPLFFFLFMFKNGQVALLKEPLSSSY